MSLKSLCMLVLLLLLIVPPVVASIKVGRILPLALSLHVHVANVQPEGSRRSRNRGVRFCWNKSLKVIVSKSETIIVDDKSKTVVVISIVAPLFSSPLGTRPPPWFCDSATCTMALYKMSSLTMSDSFATPSRRQTGLTGGLICSLLISWM